MQVVLRPGDHVTMLDAPVETLGHVVSLSRDLNRAEVLWKRRPGYNYIVTTEAISDLRKIETLAA